MNVSAAAVKIAYTVVFGEEMNKHLPFVHAAQEIKQAQPHWATLMACCESVKDMRDQGGNYLPYESLAALAAEKFAATSLLQRAADSFFGFPVDLERGPAARLEKMADDFDSWPYEFAKRHGVLVNNSAEDFSLQFMGKFNSVAYERY